MLYNEQHVEEHREQTQPKLSGVSEYRTPVIVVVSDEEHLQDGEWASGEIQEDIANAPAGRTLATVVVVGLHKKK